MPVWAIILVIIAAVICCGLCAYGISAAVHRTRDRRAQDAKRAVASRPVLPYHVEWQPGQAVIAAAGGADRRPAHKRGRADGSIARSVALGDPQPPDPWRVLSV